MAIKDLMVGLGLLTIGVLMTVLQAFTSGAAGEPWDADRAAPVSATTSD